MQHHTHTQQASSDKHPSIQRNTKQLPRPATHRALLLPLLQAQSIHPAVMSSNPRRTVAQLRADREARLQAGLNLRDQVGQAIEEQQQQQQQYREQHQQ